MRFTCIPFYCIALHNAMRKHSFDKMPMEIRRKGCNGLRWTSADLRRHLCMNTNQTKYSWILKCIGLLCSIQLYHSFWEISPFARHNFPRTKLTMIPHWICKWWIFHSAKCIWMGERCMIKQLWLVCMLSMASISFSCNKCSSYVECCRHYAEFLPTTSECMLCTWGKIIATQIVRAYFIEIKTIA